MASNRDVRQAQANTDAFFNEGGNTDNGGGEGERKCAPL